jgi:hypothetical protein
MSLGCFFDQMIAKKIIRKDILFGSHSWRITAM